MSNRRTELTLKPEGFGFDLHLEVRLDGSIRWSRAQSSGIIDSDELDALQELIDTARSAQGGDDK